MRDVMLSNMELWRNLDTGGQAKQRDAVPWLSLDLSSVQEVTLAVYQKVITRRISHFCRIHFNKLD